ncbi:UDP-N-acetylmuramate dehydrogenase [Leptolyngbya sp. FACHB-261]|uniref:UDP-N-acetylmuramate dehydrogenase n=1 Tax=Leptolyngbya sp. FACHB-261 TaxID=2692806 RepID=UPI001686C775|nr:UDP-N-acetylmuramate dehydrogenase [Leptolyngbya sp. FACHB-261]MBD2104914.1 UDP-N-acetylmuramate dehydrogenase [Leptolyngbya sp. FACHB-261]
MTIFYPGLESLSQPELPSPPSLVQRSVSLAPLTSFRVGGPAAWYAAPRTLEALRSCLQWAQDGGLPLTWLGAGSNLLISDAGLPGLVIHTRYLRGLHFDDETGQVRAAAGESIARLAWLAAARGWEGLEWAVGIPGTIGGAVVMNAGAHGAWTSQLLRQVELLSRFGGKPQLSEPEALAFSYRTSGLQTGEWVVTQAQIQLAPGGDPQRVRTITAEHLRARKSTQPYNLPSCGSVFKNPGPQTAGWLIEHTGLKGYQIGQAQVSQLHANFILNCGGATASDIWRLICHVQDQVEQHWSIRLRPEVQILGEFPAI